MLIFFSIVIIKAYTYVIIVKFFNRVYNKLVNPHVLLILLL